MKILVIGPPFASQECQQKFGPAHQYIHLENYHGSEKAARESDVVFDFLIADHPDALHFHDQTTSPVFLNTVKVSLAKLYHAHPRGIHTSRFGFNGLPTLLNKPLLEVACYHETDKAILSDICSKLATEFQLVDDRVGLITPRVICMIINEAYYTVQEGTASREDIDVAMKLGTNYPFGPFEWCARIGLKDVYETLLALYEDTRDERYKICPLLKTEYLRSATYPSAL